MALRWGIAGCGKISADFATALLRTEGAQVVAVASSSASPRAASFAADISSRGGTVVDHCASYAELAARDDIDVFYIGNLNTQHFETAMTCIKAGKNVVVEKPIGVSGKEADSLARAAQEKGVFLMEGLWTRFLPAVVKARAIIEAGEIGDIVAVHADFGFRCDDAPESRMFSPSLAGGGLNDIGIYPIAFASMAYGGEMPTLIKAVGSKHPTTGVDTSAGITALYGDTKAPGLGVITYNLRGHTPEEVVIVGTQARLIIKSPAHIATKLVVTRPEGREGASEESFELPLPEPDADFTYNYPGSEGFQYQIEEVQRCILAGLKECPKYTHKEMINIAKTMDEVREQLNAT